MDHPLVSVIVPVYNRHAMALQAVRSVCDQSYQPLQVIVVDDASTEGDPDIFERTFGTRIELIRHTRNQGPSAACNTGIHAARGRYIALMGADDLCTPDRIAHQMEQLLSRHLDILLARPQVIDSQGQPLDDRKFPVFFKPFPSGDELFHTLFYDGNFLCAPSALMRAEVIERIGLFHAGIVQLQDYDYWLRACGQELALGLTEHRVLAYRRHSDNLSSQRRMAAVEAEFPYILQRAIDLARPAALRNAFRQVLPPTLDQDRPLSRFEQSLLMLAHPLASVKSQGLALAMDVCDDADQVRQLSCRGLNLFQYIYNSTESIKSTQRP